MVDSSDWMADCIKMSHNFTTLFCTKTLPMWTFLISIHSITSTISKMMFALCGWMITFLLKSPSVLHAFQIIPEVHMGQFVFSITSSWKPKFSVFALFTFLLVADYKSFARGNQQISETINKKLCGGLCQRDSRKWAFIKRHLRSLKG